MLVETEGAWHFYHHIIVTISILIMIFGTIMYIICALTLQLTNTIKFAFIIFVT